MLTMIIAFGLCGCSDPSASADETPEKNEVLSDPVLGTFLPSLKVDKKTYYWRGLAVYVDKQQTADSIEVPDSTLITVLPVGFDAVGSIVRCSNQEPIENFEMAADFEATGTIYTNPEYPEVVYVRLKTDWIDGLYVRFTTDQLGDRNRISYHGNLYEYTGSHLQQSLPHGFDYVGDLVPVGCDALPAHDLETNFPAEHSVSVYASNEDATVIYVEKILNSRNGDQRIYYDQCTMIT